MLHTSLAYRVSQRLSADLRVDPRIELRAELARLERAWASVATALTIANFQHYVQHVVATQALTEAPVALPVQVPHYAGLFEDQGEREAQRRPAWTSGPRSKFTPAELEAAYYATPPPRSGPRVATTLQVKTKSLFYHLSRHGLSLRRLHASTPRPLR